jgi:hypothetical protein
MSEDSASGRGCLFTVRLWLEPLDEYRAELRAEVRHVASGERRTVRSLAALEAFFMQKLGEGAKGPISVIVRAIWLAPDA